MKPTMLLMKYFGLKEGQTKVDFIKELQELRESTKDFAELCELAGEELGVYPDFS